MLVRFKNVGLIKEKINKTKLLLYYSKIKKISPYLSGSQQYVLLIRDTCGWWLVSCGFALSQKGRLLKPEPRPKGQPPSERCYSCGKGRSRDLEKTLIGC